MILYVAKRIALAGMMLFGLVCITFVVSNVAPAVIAVNGICKLG